MREIDHIQLKKRLADRESVQRLGQLYSIDEAGRLALALAHTYRETFDIQRAVRAIVDSDTLDDYEESLADLRQSLREILSHLYETATFKPLFVELWEEEQEKSR
jgi:hypothetical protein